MNAALLLIPEASLILTGFLLRRYMAWPDAFWVTAEKLVYYILFPALLFNTIVRTRLSLEAAGPAIGVALVAVAAGVLMAHGARLVLRVEPMRFASGVQCAFRFNSYVALAMAERIGGQDGLALAALVVGASVPLCNLVAVYGLARHAGSNVLREIIRNPLIIATLAGLIGNALGLQLPGPLSLTLAKLGAAALALGLIGVGAGMLFEPQGRNPPSLHDRLFSVWVLTVKSFALPAVAWWAARQAGLGGMEKSVITLFAAMPTASACYILAARMGGDGPYVARLITWSLLISAVALPFWLAVV